MNELKREVSTKCKGYYLKGVDMRFSFQTLESIAEGIGAKLQAGDALIVDNVDGTKRKMFKKMKSGAIIIYATLFKDQFTELDKKTLMSNALDMFDYTK